MPINCPVLKRAVKPAVCTGRSLGPRAEEAYAALKTKLGSSCAHWAARCTHPEHGPKAAAAEGKGAEEKPAKEEKAAAKVKKGGAKASGKEKKAAGAKAPKKKAAKKE